MRNYKKEYWVECLQQCCEEHEINVTQEQVEALADDVILCQDSRELAFGPPPPNPLAEELDKTKKLLEKERSKIICTVCKGSGSLVSHGPIHSSYSQCYKCHGEGKIIP